MLDELFDDHEEFVKYFKKNDSKKVRKNLLSTDKLRFWYCMYIADLEEVWSRITGSKWAYEYCRFLKNRKEVGSRITEGKYLLKYRKYMD